MSRRPPSEKNLLANIFGTEVIIAILVTFGIVYIGINFQVKNVVLTRDEGDAIKARITTIENGMEKISMTIRDSQKETDAKMEKLRMEMRQDIVNSQTVVLQRISEVTDRLVNKIDRNHEDVKERIRETKARR